MSLKYCARARFTPAPRPQTLRIAKKPWAHARPDRECLAQSLRCARRALERKTVGGLPSPFTAQKLFHDQDHESIIGPHKVKQLLPSRQRHDPAAGHGCRL